MIEAADEDPVVLTFKISVSQYRPLKFFSQAQLVSDLQMPPF